MSTKASTAALDPFCQRLLLPQRRATRHPASGQNLQEENRRKVNSENPGKRS
jgi:hypothetical protein